MIAAWIVIALLTVAVIVLVFQRNRYRNYGVAYPILRDQFDQVYEDNQHLTEKCTSLADDVEAARRENEVALERMTAESVRQVNEHRHRLELEFAQRKRAENAASNQRSRGALVAKITEHMTPYLAGFPFNPKDARHFGEVFDFLIFDGLEAGEPVTVVFLEIKTSASGRTRRVTNPRERKLRDAIKAGRVRYEMWQPDLAGLDALEGAEAVPAIAPPSSGYAIGGDDSGPPADGG